MLKQAVTKIATRWVCTRHDPAIKSGIDAYIAAGYPPFPSALLTVEGEPTLFEVRPLTWEERDACRIHFEIEQRGDSQFLRGSELRAQVKAFQLGVKGYRNLQLEKQDGTVIDIVPELEDGMLASSHVADIAQRWPEVVSELGAVLLSGALLSEADKDF